MSKKEYFIDDRVIIPDDIKKMSKEELDQEIAKLETQARAEKERILARMASQRKTS